MNIFADITETVGRTPIVRLSRVINPEKADVLLKLESNNPFSSVKDRIGVSMIEDAEQKGIIDHETVIIEPTSGNTGIALAFVCRAKRYKLVLTMPESMSLERRAMLRALGADLVITPAEKGMKGAMEKANQLLEETNHGWMPSQFDNPANPAIHEETTGPEIWSDTGGAVDAFIVGVGTGGTLTGAGRYLRSKNPEVSIYAVEPAASPVISGGKPGPHKIQGLGAGFVPKNLDTSLLNGTITVTNEEAFAWARMLADEEGIFCGISSGANVCAVNKAIEQYNLFGKRIVTIAPSFGERYLSVPGLFTVEHTTEQPKPAL